MRCADKHRSKPASMAALKASHWLTRPGLEPVGEMAGFAVAYGLLAETAGPSEPVLTMADFGSGTPSDPAGGMAGFGLPAKTVVPWGPGGTRAEFAPRTASEPAGTMAGFASSACRVRASRRYRATVSRSMPNSRAIRRWDQPPRLKVLMVCAISILSWFIAAQGHEIDPDRNDYLTSKWLVLI